MTEYESKMKIFRQRIEECAKAGIDKAKQIAAIGGYPRFYLYCISGNKLALLTKEEADDADPVTHEMLTGESLPPNTPYAHYFTWIYERSKRAPIL